MLGKDQPLKMQPTFPASDADTADFVASVSKPRLSKYLTEANGQIAHAIQLYHWNSQLSQSLYLNLQTWEVSLRNKLNQFLIYKYNSNWPYSQVALRNFSKKDNSRLIEAIERQKTAHRTNKPTSDQIVSDLSAGFWVSQLGRSYDIPYRWRDNLKWRIFTNNQAISREDALEKCSDLLDLRNRVAHHEPIFLMPLSVLKTDIDLILAAMNPATASFMVSACSFDVIWNARPRAQSQSLAPKAEADSTDSTPNGSSPARRVLTVRSPSTSGGPDDA